MDRNRIKKRLFFWYSILWLFLAFALYQAYGVYFLDITSTKSKWVGLFAGAIGLLLASLKFCEITFFTPQNHAHKQIFKYFQSGNFVFGYKINRYVLLLGLLISLFLYKPLGLAFVFCFMLGILSIIILNMLNGFIYNYSTTKANSYLEESFMATSKISLYSGIAQSFLTVGFAIIPIVVLYHAFKDYQIISGYVFALALYYLCFGISQIITKFALKISKEPMETSFQNLNSNDKRNPLLLLNGLSSGILNIKNKINGLFVSYCLGFIGAITIGALCLNLMGAFLPIIILSNGIFASIISILPLKINKSEISFKPFCLVLLAQVIIFSALTFWTINTWLLEDKGLIISAISGAVLALVLCLLNARNEMSTKTQREIINAINLGEFSIAAQLIKASLRHIFLPTLLLAATLLSAFLAPNGIEAPLLGLYGIALSVCGYLALCPIILIIENYAQNIKTASDITDLYEKEIISTQDEKRKYIKETAQNIFSINKTYPLFATFLSAISVFISYTLVCYIEEMDILNPYILVNLIFGAIFGLFFALKLFSASGKNALKLVIESKRQFRKNPQILEYQESPNYIQPIKTLLNNNIVQTSALLLGFAVILFIDLHYLKYEAIAGFLFALILVGYTLSIFTNSLENNAKSALIFFENNYYKTQEHSNLLNIKNIAQIPYGLIYGGYDILIKFMAGLMLAMSIMFI